MTKFIIWNTVLILVFFVRIDLIVFHFLFFLLLEQCPPCRGFTPTLAEFYETLQSEHEGEVEFVFVSSDQDQGSFNEYYKDMPWTALPFDASELKEALAHKFGVRGIPFFVILNGADGTVKDADGRTTVMNARGNVDTALAKWT
jgi:thiol-disulfide isomerase/thioredoxin